MIDRTDLTSLEFEKRRWRERERELIRLRNAAKSLNTQADTLEEILHQQRDRPRGIKSASPAGRAALEVEP